VRVFAATALLTLAMPAHGEETLPTFKVLLEDGFSVSATDFRDSEMIILLTRGEHSFLCTLALSKDDGVYSGGPWNDYRECKRLSGGADFCFDKDGNEMECKY
jgi:hypothetical protein